MALKLFGLYNWQSSVSSINLIIIGSHPQKVWLLGYYQVAFFFISQQSWIKTMGKSFSPFQIMDKGLPSSYFKQYLKENISDNEK
jgi:hypothetical protein